METLNTPTKIKCKVKGCPKERRGHGYCLTHLYRVKNNLPLDPVFMRPNAIKNNTCEIDGCQRVHYARSLCRYHHARLLKGTDLERPFGATDVKFKKDPADKAPCIFEGCDGFFFARGWCAAHYQQWFDGRELTPIKRKEMLPKNENGRVCKRCKQFLPWSDYYGTSRGTGKQARCKRCMSAESSIRVFEKGKTQDRPTWAYEHLEWADAQSCES